jgi:multidrug efflux pump
MDRIADEVLDDTFRTALAGDSKDFNESASSLMFAFLLALVLIFLVLSAQFESFKDPIIVMMTVPLALTGALFFMWYFNITMNIFSQIGIIMLIGLVSKNGILIVEFANQRKKAGMNKIDAIKYAAAARFRPILMVSISTILGIYRSHSVRRRSPKPDGNGCGSVGGLMVSTFLTLYIVPAIYSYISSETKIEENEATSKLLLLNLIVLSNIQACRRTGKV